MASPVTVLGVTVLWPTTGDTGYSAATLQLQNLLATAVAPIEDLYNTTTGQVGYLAYSDTGELLLNGVPVSSGGTVTSVSIASPADLTVSGSPITTSGTINLNLTTTGVTPGSYTLSNLTVDSKGRITSISSGTTSGGTVTSVNATSSTLAISGVPITTSGVMVVDLPAQTSGGSYTNANIAVDGFGRVISATNGTPPSGGTVTSVGISGLQGVTTSGSPVTSSGVIQVGLGNIVPLTANLQNGTLTFSGSTNRVTGNFTTLSSRLAFQTNVANGNTSVELISNGTSTNSTLNLNNSSDVNNSGVLSIGAQASSAFISTAIRGTGTAIPLSLGVNGLGGRLIIGTDGNVSIAQNITVTGTVTASNLSGTNTGDQTITATGDATGVSTGSPATSLPLTLANTTVVPGTYPFATIDVDSKGRITAASSGTPTTSVWGNITGDINDQTDLLNILTSIGTSVLSTGVTTSTDTIGLTALTDFTLRLKPVEQAIFYDLIPTGIDNATRTFGQIDYPLSSLPGIVTDGIYIRFIGVNEAGTVIVSDQNFSTDETTLQYGYIIVKRVAGVNTFLDGTAGPRNVFTWPSFAGNNAAIDEFLIAESDIAVAPNPNLTVNNATGVVKGLGINWGTGNVNQRTKASANPTSFITINPSTSLAVILPPAGTAVQVTQYWNGSAMTTMSGPNNASVQRFIITIAGQIFLQVGEQQYTNLDDAVDAIGTAPFTPILPRGSTVELCRVAARRGATTLTNNADAVFSYGGGSAGGGTSVGTVTSVAVAGTQGVTSAGGPITSNGTITVGLGDITPTTVSTGNTTVAGNLTFTGNARRITGNFAASGTATDAVLVQTSSANSATAFAIAPSGTSTSSHLYIYNSSAPATTSRAVLSIDATNVTLASSPIGGGTQLPVRIVTAGLVPLSAETNGNLQIGLPSLATTAVAGFPHISSMAGTPTGVPTAITGKAPITVNTANNKFNFYSTGAWRTLEPYPDQATHAGDALLTDGTNVYWGLPVASSANIFQYSFSSATVPPPSGGQIRYNNSIQVTATKAYVDVSSATPTIDLTNYYRKITPNTIFWVQARSDSTHYHRWLITAVAEFSTYFEWTIELLDENGGNFGGGNSIVIGYVFAGQESLDLNDLGDVTLTSPTDGQVLTYDSGTSQWVNETPSGGGTPAGANTEIQFNNGGAFGASANLTWNGTQVSLGGNLNFAGTGRKITGDMSNATVANRLSFQSTTVNGNSLPQVVPNGTASIAGITAYNSSDPTNASTIYVQARSTDVRVGASLTGSGVIKDLLIFGGVSGSSLGLSLLANNNVALGNTGPLAASATDGHIYIIGTSGTPTGVPSGAGNRAPITVDTTNNKMYFYSSGAWREAGGGGGGITLNDILSPFLLAGC